MTNDLPKAAGRAPTTISNLDGADPAVRQRVERSGASVEEAAGVLKEALAELHRSDDEAWRRYASELEEATNRFETSLGLASARLRAERATSKEDLRTVLHELTDSWRARADEARVRAHIGRMDARDLVSETVTGLDLAGQRMAAVVARLREEVGDTLVAMRAEVSSALDDAARILRSRSDDDS